MNFKEIHIGKLISQLVIELNVEIPRILNFLKCTEEELEDMYRARSIDSDLLLKWSKLLEYDFFRLYSQHLILYAPQSGKDKNSENKNKSKLPTFRKNIYTREVIDFILELYNSGEKTKNQIIEEYKIPKTTFYKWLKKYNSGLASK